MSALLKHLHFPLCIVVLVYNLITVSYTHLNDNSHWRVWSIITDNFICNIMQTHQKLISFRMWFFVCVDDIYPQARITRLHVKMSSVTVKSYQGLLFTFYFHFNVWINNSKFHISKTFFRPAYAVNRTQCLD